MQRRKGGFDGRQSQHECEQLRALVLVWLDPWFELELGSRQLIQLRACSGLVGDHLVLRIVVLQRLLLERFQ